MAQMAGLAIAIRNKFLNSMEGICIINDRIMEIGIKCENQYKTYQYSTHMRHIGGTVKRQ